MQSAPPSGMICSSENESVCWRLLLQQLLFAASKLGISTRSNCFWLWINRPFLSSSAAGCCSQAHSCHHLHAYSTSRHHASAPPSSNTSYTGPPARRLCHDALLCAPAAAAATATGGASAALPALPPLGNSSSHCSHHHCHICCCHLNHSRRRALWSMVRQQQQVCMHGATGPAKSLGLVACASAGLPACSPGTCGMLFSQLASRLLFCTLGGTGHASEAVTCIFGNCAGNSAGHELAVSSVGMVAAIGRLQ